MCILSYDNMPTPLIRIFQNDWSCQAGEAIRCAIEDAILVKGTCSLMLTGGNTVKRIYQYWANQRDFPHDRITYFFGDERCVAFDHPESNYGMACRSLFPQGIPEHVHIHPMDGSSGNRVRAARHYEENLPPNIDVLLLGLGEDGHVASLFPGDPATIEVGRLVMPVIGIKSPRERLTITPKVIAGARTVFLLATGALKGKVLSRVLNEGCSAQELPVRCAKGAIWLLDKVAAQELYEDLG